jgi:uncharacterized membrane protein HdeD (DUF308 family)
MMPLMLGLTLEVYLLGLLVIGDPKTSLAVSTALLGVFSLLWFMFPLRCAFSIRRIKQCTN